MSSFIHAKYDNEQRQLIDPNERSRSVTYTFDASGKVVGLFNPVTGITTPIGSTQLLKGLNTLAVFGNSKMAYGLDNTLGNYSNSSIGWANDYLRINNSPGFDVIDNFSVGGSTLDDILSSQGASVIASPANFTWGQFGINNLASGGINDTVATWITKATAVLDLITPSKIGIIVDSVETVLQSGSTTATTRAFTIPIINEAFKKICANYSNVIFNDTNSVIVDPASTQLNPLANMLRTDDGIHYVSNGARTTGNYSAKNIAPKVILTRYKTLGTNILPAFTGTGGTVTANGFVTVTGTPPLGWEIVGATGAAATHSVGITQVAPDLIRLTCANTGATSAGFQLKVSNLQAGINSGNTIQGGFGFQVSSITNMQRLGLVLRINTNGATWSAMTIAPQEPTITYPTQAHSGFRACNPWIIPGTVGTPLTNLEYIISVSLGATTGAAIIDIYTPNLAKLT